MFVELFRWTKIFSVTYEKNGPGPKFSQTTLQILVHLNIAQDQNFQRGTKIFSVISEKKWSQTNIFRINAEKFDPAD